MPGPGPYGNKRKDRIKKALPRPGTPAWFKRYGPKPLGKPEHPMWRGDFPLRQNPKRMS